MKMKKMAAAVLAVVAASVPMTGALNNGLSVTASAEETFTEGDWEYEINNDGDGITLTKYTGTDTEVVIPSTLGGKSVTSMRYTFMDCDFVKSVTIPDSVTRIGFNAFASCISLESVTIPDSVTYIGYQAFVGCQSLEGVTIPESVAEIDVSAFRGCTSIKSITLPNGITGVNDVSLSYCTSLETLILPNSIKGIYDGALIGCTSLKNIIFNGTEDEWNAVIIADNCLEYIENATITFNVPTETDPNPTNPGDTDPADEQEILEVTLKNVDSENGIEGEALDALLFGDSGWTWEQVEKIEFTSDDLFSVSYKAEDGWKKLGEKVSDRADDDDIWNTAWTLNTADMAKDEKLAKIIAKDGIIDVTAKVYIKAGAEKPEDGANANTGIALAIAPAVLAAGFVIVASKKKK